MEAIELLSKHSVLIGSCIGLGITLTLLRRYFIGGVCRSKARLEGKTVIITGANTGIGKETAIELAKRGAKVILACRDSKKAEEAADDVIRQSKNSNVFVKILDLASLESVRKFSDHINKTEPYVHILINNAGVYRCPYWKTEDGFEMHFGANHLGHFLLTNLLLEKIKQSAPARIINVSSIGHIFGKINFDDINSEKDYDGQGAYSQSKLANVLFTRELSKRLQGSGVTVNSLHPGAVDTDIKRYLPLSCFLVRPFFLFFSKTCKQGAQTSIHCAVEETLANVTGKYFSDCKIKGESRLARDDDLAKKLWALSEEMVHLKS